MKEKKRSYSLYYTLLMSFLICVITALLFLVVTVVPRVSGLIRSNAVDRIRETVQQSASGFAQYTDNLQSTMQFALSLVPDDPRLRIAWHDQLELLKNAAPEINNFALFDENGALIYSTAGRMKTNALTVAKTDWFVDALEREGLSTCFSAPHVQAIFENQYAHVITLSRGVRYSEGGQNKTGVLMMDISFTHFSRLVSSVTLGRSGYAFVVDPDDNIVMHPRKSQIDLALYKEDLTPVAEGIVGMTQGKKDGRDCVYVIQSLDRTRWRMVGIAFADEISQLLTSVRHSFLAAVISAAMVAAGIALLLTGLITRPLKVLEGAMLRVRHGDMDVTMREDGFTEIQLISSSFNKMLSRLKELMQQIVEEQEKKRLYELNALQAQINPHFLYNTLDSIIWMEERGRNAEAIKMVSALARLFRISISKGRTEITVKEELEYVRNYLIIQKMRFKDKFEYSIEAEDEVLSLRTLKLILQPLAENALNHAIDETLDEQLHLSIAAKRDGDTLRFVISDDGVGIPDEKLHSLLTLPPGKSGIGLKNVHERIQLTYGREYGLTLESREDEGTRVTISLPLFHGGKDA